MFGINNLATWQMLQSICYISFCKKYSL